jgi:PTS system nitrogen regulatory IIA component
MDAPSWQSVFGAGSVVWELESTDKYGAIREIVHRSAVFRNIPSLDLSSFAESVIEREQIQSTGFGHGVAVAHGRTPEVAQSKIALGVSKRGVSYDSVDGAPVHLLFIVANHPERQMDYLQILSKLVSLVRDPQFREELLSCMSKNELEDKICNAFHDFVRRADQRRAPEKAQQYW